MQTKLKFISNIGEFVIPILKKIRVVMQGSGLRAISFDKSGKDLELVKNHIVCSILQAILIKGSRISSSKEYITIKNIGGFINCYTIRPLGQIGDLEKMESNGLILAPTSRKEIVSPFFDTN